VGMAIESVITASAKFYNSARSLPHTGEEF
jgi:hypothetical protein